MERYPPLSADQMDTEQQQLADHYRSGWRGLLGSSDGRLGGPLDTLLRAPELARRISKLSDYFRDGSSLDRRISEFAILTLARSRDSAYEWGAHVAWALEAGVSPATVDALGSGGRPQAMADDEAAAFDLLDELRRTNVVSDACFERTRTFFTDRQILELVAVSGFYGVVANVLAIANVGAPQGKPALPVIARRN